MAVPSNPTVSSIVQDALRHVLTATPTSGQETELTNNGFQTVKTEIWEACTTDRLLSTTTMIVLSQGSGQVDTPSDFDHELMLDVYTCPDSMTWTAQTGASGSITAASTFSADVSSLRGLYIFTTSGTGSGQYRQITDYNDTTKVISITPNWSVTPNSTTVAFIGTQRTRLIKDDPGTWSSAVLYPNQGRPMRYRVVGSSPLNTSDNPAIEIMPAPDKTQYAMLLTYGPNLTRLDETGTLFVKHLRERRAIWIQGLISQAARRYDEARYPVEYGRYQEMLLKHAGHNVQYDQMSFER